MQITAEIIRDQEITCMMTTHNLSQVNSYGNMIIALSSGKIKFKSQGLHKSTLSHADLLEDCYSHFETTA
jgi:putative ABC transport system ATP-binding protein